MWIWEVSHAVRTLQDNQKADRVLLREMLLQVLSLTQQQTVVLGQWMTLLADQKQRWVVTGTPRTETPTEKSEWETWAANHAPELIDTSDENQQTEPS